MGSLDFGVSMLIAGGWCPTWQIQHVGSEPTELAWTKSGPGHSPLAPCAAGSRETMHQQPKLNTRPDVKVSVQLATRKATRHHHGPNEAIPGRGVSEGHCTATRPPSVITFATQRMAGIKTTGNPASPCPFPNSIISFNLRYTPPTTNSTLVSQTPHHPSK